MDYWCQDIPMRLDVRFQPLNFDIYLREVIEVPRTSLDQNYDFSCERQALDKVDQIIKRIYDEEHKNVAIEMPALNELKPETLTNSATQPSIKGEDTLEQLQPQSLPNLNNMHLQTIPSFTLGSALSTASCPTETPLTPTTLTHFSSTNHLKQQKNETNRVNPREFEDNDYNPFDQVELQTIDDMRELDLVFKASYANKSEKEQ